MSYQSQGEAVDRDEAQEADQTKEMGHLRKEGQSSQKSDKGGENGSGEGQASSYRSKSSAPGDALVNGTANEAEEKNLV